MNSSGNKKDSKSTSAISNIIDLTQSSGLFEDAKAAFNKPLNIFTRRKCTIEGNQSSTPLFSLKKTNNKRNNILNKSVNIPIKNKNNDNTPSPFKNNTNSLKSKRLYEHMSGGSFIKQEKSLTPLKVKKVSKYSTPSAIKQDINQKQITNINNKVMKGNDDVPLTTPLAIARKKYQELSKEYKNSNTKVKIEEKLVKKNVSPQSGLHPITNVGVNKELFEKINNESNDITYIKSSKMLHTYILMRVLPFDLVIYEKRDGIIRKLLQNMYSAKNWFLFFEFEENNHFILDKEKCKELVILNEDLLPSLYDLYKMAIIIIQMKNEDDYKYLTDIWIGLARQRWIRDNDSGLDTINWLSFMLWPVQSKVIIEKAKMLYSKGGEKENVIVLLDEFIKNKSLANKKIIQALIDDIKHDKFTYKLNLNMIGSVIDEILTNM